MSQGFPPPSGPPGPPGPPGLDYRGTQRDPAEIARRASIVLFILGGLVALLGVGNSALAFTFSGDELVRLNKPMMPASQPSGGVQLSPASMKVGMAVVGVLEVLVGLGIMLLGAPVRRGRPWAVITGVATVSVIGALCLIMLLFCLLLSIMAPQVLGVACMLGVPTVLCGLLLKWLIQVMRALRPVTLPHAGPAPANWRAPVPPPNWPPHPGLGPQPDGGYSPAMPPSPPAGQRPVRYGYAQPPGAPAPPAGDAPIGSGPASLPPAPLPDSLPGPAEPPDRG